MAAPGSDMSSTSSARPLSASSGEVVDERADGGVIGRVEHARRQQELRRFRDYTYWSLVGVSGLVLLTLATTGRVPYPPAAPGLALFGGLAVVLVALGQLASQLIPRETHRRPLSTPAYRIWATVGLSASVVVSTLWVVHGELWLWTIAPAAVLSLLVAGVPKRQRRLAVAVCIAGVGVAGALIGAIRDEPVMAYVMMPALATAFWLSITLASVWTWDVVLQLDEARRTASSLAVANERLRFAADLHDIQGHSLQVIALKSELASRLAVTDADAAAAEMEAVRGLAADALRDTRSVVEGYRRTSLDAEIANASNVLGSAGIVTRLDLEASPDAAALPPPVRHLLGLVVREAVTNTLRHSTATEASVALRLDRSTDRIQLLVRNDNAASPVPGRTGGGLSQLANRLSDAGGRLSWEHRDDRFEVRADLPLDARGDAGNGRNGGADALAVDDAGSEGRR